VALTLPACGGGESAVGPASAPASPPGELSWETRRGIDPSDRGLDAILIKAPPSDVSAALVRRGARLDADALGKEVTIASAIAIVVRFRGHAWTTVLEDGCSSHMSEQLAKDLAVPVLEIASSEDDIEYRYFEKGDLVEHLAGNREQVARFESRQRARADLGERSAYEVADGFVKEKGAYVPDLRVTYFFSQGGIVPDLGPGGRRRLNNPGIVVSGPGGESVSRPDIEKLDYLRVAP
jgi:hypothetical protein